MNARNVSKYALLVFVAVSLFYWVYAEVRGKPADGPRQAASAVEDSRKVVAYYFHGKVRCQSCVNIERFSGEAVHEGFADEVKSGLLEYKSVNMQEPGNEHYFDDYQLSSWALVLVEYKQGRQTKWKNLQRVWELVAGDPAVFREYVKGEVADFLARGE